MRLYGTRPKTATTSESYNAARFDVPRQTPAHNVDLSWTSSIFAPEENAPQDTVGFGHPRNAAGLYTYSIEFSQTTQGSCGLNKPHQVSLPHAVPLAPTAWQHDDDSYDSKPNVWRPLADATSSCLTKSLSEFGSYSMHPVPRREYVNSNQSPAFCIEPQSLHMLPQLGVGAEFSSVVAQNGATSSNQFGSNSYSTAAADCLFPLQWGPNNVPGTSYGSRINASRRKALSEGSSKIQSVETPNLSRVAPRRKRSINTDAKRTRLATASYRGKDKFYTADEERQFIDKYKHFAPSDILKENVEKACGIFQDRISEFEKNFGETQTLKDAAYDYDCLQRLSHFLAIWNGATLNEAESQYSVSFNVFYDTCTRLKEEGIEIFTRDKGLYKTCKVRILETTRTWMKKQIEAQSHLRTTSGIHVDVPAPNVRATPQTGPKDRGSVPPGGRVTRSTSRLMA